MADAYFHKGMFHEAEEAEIAFLRSNSDKQHLSMIKIAAGLEPAYRLGGIEAWNRKALEIQLTDPRRPSFPLAAAYAVLGNDAKAFEYLDRAYAKRDSDILFINVEPSFDRLRADPRFIAMVQKIGLP
jgi:hypothetical protein